jgi:hypothetical protein
MAAKGTGSGSSDETQAAREALDWIRGRLTVLEYLILFLAMILALLGGALVAWILDAVVPLSFRWLWAGAALLLFILPGGFVYLREFRNRGRVPGPDAEPEPKEPNG